MQQNAFLHIHPLRSSETTASLKPQILSENHHMPFRIARRRELSSQPRQISPTAHWTNQEKQKYSIFACYFRQLLSQQLTSKNNWNIFKGMSKFIKSRNPQQCRSHHLKLLRQFKTIQIFISEVVKRVNKLKQRIFRSEQQLIQIQNQFNLKLNLVRLMQSNIKQEGEVNYMRSERQELGNQDTGQKKQKQDFKTADSYVDQQNPVKSNNNNFTIFSSRSQFKPFQSNRLRQNRHSLPNFSDDPEQSGPIKNQYYQSDLKHKITSFSSGVFDQNINKKSQQKPIKQKVDSIHQQSQNMQKIKQFMQCHYLFQLWTSKLQKIIRQTSNDNYSNQN